MTAPPADTERTNPFSTRFVRPGELAYRFPVGENSERLIDRLSAAGWRGQIIGPHGSGKSTLLAGLAVVLAAAGRAAFVVTLRDRQRRMPRHWQRQAGQSGARLIIVDGYEQLGLWSRWLLAWHCRRRGWGLLVTAHTDVGLPTLLTTTSSLETAQAIVASLVQDQGAAITDEDVAACFAASAGNLRETLFRLYDLWEARRE